VEFEDEMGGGGCFEGARFIALSELFGLLARAPGFYCPVRLDKVRREGGGTLLPTLILHYFLTYTYSEL
jgi:hypothetical protein